MFEYTGSGLNGIFLKNGYTLVESDFGPGVAIQDVEGLHRAIAAEPCVAALEEPAPGCRTPPHGAVAAPARDRDRALLDVHRRAPDRSPDHGREPLSRGAHPLPGAAADDPFERARDIIRDPIRFREVVAGAQRQDAEWNARPGKLRGDQPNGAIPAGGDDYGWPLLGRHPLAHDRGSGVGAVGRYDLDPVALTQRALGRLPPLASTNATGVGIGDDQRGCSSADGGWTVVHRGVATTPWRASQEGGFEHGPVR